MPTDPTGPKDNPIEILGAHADNFLESIQSEQFHRIREQKHIQFLEKQLKNLSLEQQKIYMGGYFDNLRIHYSVQEEPTLADLGMEFENSRLETAYLLKTTKRLNLEKERKQILEALATSRNKNL
ncbi:MAG: hypothetical protein WCX73_05775 [Candidatus Pacearchaeota archaeon]